MNENRSSSVQCPSCNKNIWLAQRLRISAFKSPDEKQEAIIKNDWRNSKTFGCPHCNSGLQIRYQLTILDIFETDSVESPRETGPNDWTATKFTENEIKLLEYCRSSGITDSFAEIVIAQTNILNRPPKDIDKFLITFFRTCVRSLLPKEALEEFVIEFPGKIEFWKSNGIGMVISNGIICRFIPIRSLVFPKKRYKVNRLVISGTDAHYDARDFEYVRKTKYGYVPSGSRLFLEALRHSLGDNGREMQNVPLNSVRKMR